MFTVFKHRRVVKIHRDLHCNICHRKLKGEYHSEYSWIVTARVCHTCRDDRRNFIKYLLDKPEIDIEKIDRWLADMKLLDIKLPIDIIKDVKRVVIKKQPKLHIKAAMM